MIKESLKTYLDEYFESYKKYMGTYPTVPYDEDEESSLWFGEVKDEDYIQWMYKEKDEITLFTELENEIGEALPDSIKEFYNSWYFLQLQGFYNGESLLFDNISDSKDILNDLRDCIFTIEGRKYLQMGIYGNMCLALCIQLNSGEMVYVDYDCNKVEKLADSLDGILTNMTPMR